MSLRLRLLALVAGLAIVALIAVETVTYFELRSFLYSQIDRTVRTSVEVVGDTLASGKSLNPADLQTLVSTTPGLYIGDLGPNRRSGGTRSGLRRAPRPPRPRGSPTSLR